MLVIPERTIDTLFTFELISAAPTAIVVSPNNNRGPRTPDHEVRMARRSFIFECKTLYSAGQIGSPWVVRVPTRQLKQYLTKGQPRVTYVLPSEPDNRLAPWIRTCPSDPDPDGRCIACSNPGAAGGALFRRRWAGRQAHVASAPVETRMQPWFNHWAWLVPADNLAQHIGPQLLAGAGVDLPADDLSMGTIMGAVRLCHALQWIATDALNASNNYEDFLPDDNLGQFEAGSVEGMIIEDDDHRLVFAY